MQESHQSRSSAERARFGGARNRGSSARESNPTSMRARSVLRPEESFLGASLLRGGLVGAVLSSVLVACGGGDSPPNDSSGGSGGAAMSSGGQEGSGGNASGGSFGGSESGGAATGGDGATDGSGGTTDADPLPNGSSEYEGILNLVDAEAYAQLERAMRQEEGQNLSSVARRFYEFYPDEYDFLLFITSEAVENTNLSAYFRTINSPALPGTGIDKPRHQGGFGSRGRLKGVMGAQGGPEKTYPPFDHELAHYWGASLSPDLGFQYDPDFDMRSHWGYVSVNGQLGGFDATTLRCETPSDAVPPDCTPESDGTTVYRTARFAPNTNSFRGADFAPLELYVMGLVPKADVPPMIAVQSPRYLETGADYSLFSGEGLVDVTIDDIVAIHGERAPTPEDQRHFDLAFVLVSEQPASAERLEQAANWAAIWGDRVPAQGSWTSFHKKTGGRLTLSTELGRRRTADDQDPLPALPENCDTLAQDCGEQWIGCFDFVCKPSAEVPAGEACEYQNDCAPGSSCVNGQCAAFCSQDPSSDKFCDTLCPANVLSVSSAEQEGFRHSMCGPG